MTMTTKQVSKFQKETSLAEIMQQNKTQFALCRYDEDKDTLIQCHQFVHCRDFMHDAFVAVESNREMGIWGFKFGKDNPRPDYTATSILLRFPDAGTLKNFNDNLSILKNIEETLGFSPHCVEVVDYPDKGHQAVIWLMADSAWQQNAVAFSLFGYLIKCFGYKINNKEHWMEEIQTNGTNEAEYMNIPWVTWLTTGGLNAIEECYKNYSGWETQATANCGLIHDQSGFVTVGNRLWNDKKGKVSSSYNHALDGFSFKVAA